MDVIYDVCNKAGVPCALSEVFAKGGEGGKALAETVLSILDDSAEVQYTYELDAPLTDKIEAVATKIYRAGRVSYTAAAKKGAGRADRAGLWQAAGLHCQNAVFLQRQRQADGCARGSHAECARGAFERRCGLCGRCLRQHHDDARPAQAPRRHGH